MPKTLRNQIASSLRGQILAGKWPEGTRIKEEALAKQFGVSRGPIRDVFLELSKEGFLQGVPNKGASINAFPSPKARAIFLKTRRELEALALIGGFPNWEDSDLKEMEKILRYFRVAAEDNELSEVIQHDMAFHQFIIEHFTKDNLMVVWLPLMTTLALPYSRHANLLESYEEHVAILNELKSGHLKSAVKLLKQNIQ